MKQNKNNMRQHWIDTLNSGRVDLEELKKYYLEHEKNKGESFFNQYFLVYLQESMKEIEHYILDKFKIFKLLDVNGLLIKYC